MHQMADQTNERSSLQFRSATEAEDSASYFFARRLTYLCPALLFVPDLIVFHTLWARIAEHGRAGDGRDLARFPIEAGAVVDVTERGFDDVAGEIGGDFTKAGLLR